MLHASASPSREGWLARTFARLKAAPSAPPPFAPLHTKASRTGPLIALESLHQPVWSPRDYASFSREGMMQNAIVFRAVRMVAEAAASVPLLLYEGDMEIDSHPLIDLLARPNPVSTTPDLLEAWYGYLLVSGNAYLEAVAIAGDIRELHVLRPDRMKVIPGLDGWPEAYEYTANGESVRFAGEVAPGIRPILHPQSIVFSTCWSRARQNERSIRRTDKGASEWRHLSPAGGTGSQASTRGCAPTNICRANGTTGTARIGWLWRRSEID